MRHIGLILIAGLAWPACFSPTLPDCEVACGNGQKCPSDFICDQNLCRRQSSRACSPADAALELQPADGAVADGAGDAVTACSSSPGPSGCQTTSAGCANVFCGTPLWRTEGLRTLIPFRIRDPAGRFGPQYKLAIRQTALQWNAATTGAAGFQECSPCTGRFISIVPGNGDGLENPDKFAEQFLPLPVSDAHTPDNDPPWHVIGHQLGHAFGLAHTFQRPDRDRFITFDSGPWCSPTGGPAPVCATDNVSQPGSPPFVSGTFGVFDAKSKMNALPGDGICPVRAADFPDASTGMPTLGDISAVHELELSWHAGWTPFQPITPTGRVRSETDYQLRPGVSPAGTPAIAEWASPGIEVIVRGTDGNVYETTNVIQNGQWLEWAAWNDLGGGFTSDPAATYVDENRLLVTAHSGLAEGAVTFSTRSGATWGPWQPIGTPTTVGDSAPAVAASGGRVHFFVIGGDGFLYEQVCDATSAPNIVCPSSTAGANWHLLGGATSDQKRLGGSPSAAVPLDGVVVVAATGIDGTLWLRTTATGSWGDWTNLADMVTPTPPTEADSAGLASWGGGRLDIFIRNADGLLAQMDAFVDQSGEIWHGYWSNLGGLPVSGVSASATKRGDSRISVLTQIDDHGQRGVWWKFSSPKFRPPCNFNLTGTCARCGCDDVTLSCAGQ